MSRTRARNCIDSADSVRKFESLEIAMPMIQHLGELMWHIPEYHDEQRLRSGPTIFGPMTYVYASPALGSFTTHAQFREHGARGVLVAVVTVLEGDVGEALPPSYQALNLTWGLNCVWLSYQENSAGENEWKGYVSPADAARRCPDPVNPTPHPVRRTRSKSKNFFWADTYYKIADYPPVARFSETEVATPLIGVKCLDAWCEIGPGAENTVATLTNRLPSGMKDRRADRIAGWHDEQVLTDRLPPGRFVPAIRAKISPWPKIERYTLADFVVWKRVATITLDGDPEPGSKYFKWGLRGGDEFKGNILEMMRTGSAWRVRVIAQPNSGELPPTEWTFVERHPHLDAAVPATVRFRWTVADDGIWVPCGQGCCKAEGPQG